MKNQFPIHSAGPQSVRKQPSTGHLSVSRLITRAALSAVVLMGGVTVSAQSKHPLLGDQIQAKATYLVNPNIELLQGRWSAVARICQPSGRRANDALNLETDKIEIRISGDKVTGLVKMARQSWRIEGVVDLKNQLFIFPATHTDKTTFEAISTQFELTAFPTLVMTSGGFGEGGSCLPGEMLQTYLRKVDRSR